MFGFRFLGYLDARSPSMAHSLKSAHLKALPPETPGTIFLVCPDPRVFSLLTGLPSLPRGRFQVCLRAG